MAGEPALAEEGAVDQDQRAHGRAVSSHEVLPGGARLTLRGRVEATILRAVLAALKA